LVIHSEMLSMDIHHDFLGKVEREGTILFKDKNVDIATGAYKAEVSFDGVHYITKTFFPSEWTREKVLKEIVYSINHAIKEPEIADNFLIKFMGKSTNGLRIETYINKNGKVITSFPKL
jgi:hypothetical protein